MRRGEGFPASRTEKLLVGVAIGLSGRHGAEPTILRAEQPWRLVSDGGASGMKMVKKPGAYMAAGCL